jgi:hypothetical protein
VIAVAEGGFVSGSGLRDDRIRGARLANAEIEERG